MSSEIGIGRRALILAGVVLLVAILAAQTYIVAGDGRGRLASSNDPVTPTTKEDTSTVSGTGQVAVLPDVALVMIGVVTQDSTAGGAVQQNANRMSSVISAVEGAGISNSSIHTVSYSINPQQSCCNGPPSITGYQVTNEVQVTIVAAGPSLAKLGAKVGQVIDAAASGGANQMYGIQFTASDAALQQAQRMALQQAVENASRDAHVLASAAGVSITGVVSITSNPVYSPHYYPVALSAMSSALPTPIIAPQSLTVAATVQVVYSIG
jgi:uncharacterized protein YggE